MKKILLSMALMAFIGSANAQLWFGGGISFSHNGGSAKTANTDHKVAGTSSFSFEPMVGFDLSDKLSVGGKLNFATSSGKSYMYDADDKETVLKSTTNTVGVIPFARYKFVEFNKFGLLAEAGLPIANSSSKNDNGSNTTKGDPTTSFGLYVVPMLTYGLNDNFQLECSLDFLALNASHSVSKDRDDSKNKSISNSFDFGADTRDVATLGWIKIGFIYKL